MSKVFKNIDNDKVIFENIDIIGKILKISISIRERFIENKNKEKTNNC